MKNHATRDADRAALDARHAATRATFETDVPARLDRLPWSRFHRLVIMALGITWILDGLEVTLVGSLGPALTDQSALGLRPSDVGYAASAYLVGAILGALGFGYLADRFGRKRLFFVTLAVYGIATIATGLAWNFTSFAIFRALTGAGIGGEYSAINSAIQELIPARFRGWTDLAVNGSFWLGAILGALGSVVALDPAFFSPQLGWRVPFLLGGVLAALVMLLRRYIPESPRWLMTHGKVAAAEQVVAAIEEDVRRQRPDSPPPPRAPRIRLQQGGRHKLIAIARLLIATYPRRTLLGLVLMAAQAFLYNAIFFTYALVLARFYAVPSNAIGFYIIAFAIANLLGPLVLGPLFDTLGRRPMIAATYGVAGLLMAATAFIFDQGNLSASGQTAAWMAIFFAASAAASAAYLTVGESFPLEARALIIALFYAFGTTIGGVAGPAIFGALIETGSRRDIMWGYLAGAAFMMIAALTEIWLGLAAERRPLEEVAAPLAAIAADDGSKAVPPRR